MTGLIFEGQAPPTASPPNRADVACFVGFVRRRRASELSLAVRRRLLREAGESAASQEYLLPIAMKRWLAEEGWTAPFPEQEAGQERTLPHARPIGEVRALEDVPVPINFWDAFDLLFAWEDRPLDGSGQVGASYLGAAVRSFFALGGRKCYVVRVGDPWEYTESRETRISQISRLIPGFPGLLESSTVDRRSWHGVAHLFGLPDVSFVCLPDLADAVRVERTETLSPIEIPEGREQFVECSDEEPVSVEGSALRLLRAPRSDREGYVLWARALHAVAELIARYRREVHLAVPIPYTPPATTGVDEAGNQDLMQLLASLEDAPLGYRLDERGAGLASAFVQLAYPWVKTPGSSLLPEGIEPPEGALIGLLARNALTNGTYRSAAGQYLGDIYEVYPVVRRDHMVRLWPDFPGALPACGFIERVSLLGPTPDGLELLSDVTTSLDASYRPASVSRLVASVLRAARRLGEDAVFEPSGERLWGRVTERMNGLLRGMHQAGALRGARPAEAFRVRCDRSTMTQQDIDSGRVVAHVSLNPSAPIGEITVAMTLEEGGRVSLASAG